MACSLDPNHAEAFHELGVVLAIREKFDEAEANFLKAIELDPDFGNAYKDLGSTRGRQGKFQEAIAPLREALRINPQDAECHMMLGTTLSGLGQIKEGQTHLDMAIRLDSVYADARRSVDMADGFLETGKLDEAAIHYRRALEQGPDYVPALVSLASILATVNEENLRDGKEAIALAEKACELTRYTGAAALAVLAAAHAETGQFQNAVAIAERALQAARRVQKESLAAWIEQELEGYRQKSPSRRSIAPWPTNDPHRSN